MPKSQTSILSKPSLKTSNQNFSALRAEKQSLKSGNAGISTSIRGDRYQNRKIADPTSSDSETEENEFRPRRNKRLKPTTSGHPSGKSANQSLRSTSRNEDMPRLYGGKELPPTKHVEHQGREIIQVVEELMGQASTLKNRLINMIAYFQETIGTCADLMQQTSDLSESLCTCKSGNTLLSQCRSKAGSIAASESHRSGAKDTYSNASKKSTYQKPSTHDAASTTHSFTNKSEHLGSIPEDMDMNAKNTCLCPCNNERGASGSRKASGYNLRPADTDKEIFLASVAISKQALSNMTARSSLVEQKQKPDNDIPRDDQGSGQEAEEYMESPSRQEGGASSTTIIDGTADANPNPNEEQSPTTGQQASKLTKESVTSTKQPPNTAISSKQQLQKSTRAYSGEDGQTAPQPSSLTGVEDRVKEVQKDIQELRQQMALLAGCTCAANGGAFTQTLSGQLLGKANEIKDLLNTIKSDCYQRMNMSAEDLPDTGQQTIKQNCEKEIRRVHPDFTRTVNQVQNVQADRNRTGDLQVAKVTEAMETNIDTKYKDKDTPENVAMKTKVEATEQVKNLGRGEKQRQTTTEAEKTIKTGERAFREVNTINEDDVVKNEARIITTTKKVTRTEIIEGSDPKEEVITNITIRRVIDNKTGKITETITDGDKPPFERTRDVTKSRITFKEDERKEGGVEKVSHLTQSNIGKQKAESFQNMSCKQVNLSSAENDEEQDPVLKSVSDGNESDDSVSQFISKRSYADDDYPPPSKVRKIVPDNRSQERYTPSNGNNILAGQACTCQPDIEKSNAYHRAPPNTENRLEAQERDVESRFSAGKLQIDSITLAHKSMHHYTEDDFLQRQSAGFSLKNTCSKVRYVAPNSEIPGIQYIGCQKSDMSKYPSHRTKVSADNRLILESKPSKTSIHPHNSGRKSPNKSPSRGSMTNVAESSHHTGGGEPQMKSESVQTQTEPKADAKAVSSSKPSKPVFRERKDSLNRSVGGTNIDIPGQEKKQQPASSSRSAKSGKTSMPDTLPADNIIDIIRKLSGSRSPQDFFVSILPEKIEMKVFRINVIDKETGKVLGQFFVDEDEFKKARDDGIFDNYLSLFVLNSLGSYNDFVEHDNLNTQNMQPFPCIGKCKCKADKSKD